MHHKLQVSMRGKLHVTTLQKLHITTRHQSHVALVFLLTPPGPYICGSPKENVYHDHIGSEEVQWNL